jgi:hypothetical protein
VLLIQGLETFAILEAFRLEAVSLLLEPILVAFGATVVRAAEVTFPELAAGK